MCRRRSSLSVIVALFTLMALGPHQRPSAAAEVRDDGKLRVVVFGAHPDDAEIRGLFHMTAAGGPVSWAQFAEEIFAQSAALGGPSARVRAISTAQYPTAAKRPAWSWLDGGKLQRIHGFVLPDWRDGLRRAMERLDREGEWR